MFSTQSDKSNPICPFFDNISLFTAEMEKPEIGISGKRLKKTTYFTMILFPLFPGILVNFISYPVINAFTSAAAITIACGQIKGILGLTHIPREFLHMVYETCKKIPQTK